MADETFLPIDGATVMYDVIRNGVVIGLVWKQGAEWFADATNMAAPSIRERSREEAASKL
jgi:hypothetical protein